MFAWARGVADLASIYVGFWDLTLAKPVRSLHLDDATLDEIEKIRIARYLSTPIIPTGHRAPNRVTFRCQTAGRFHSALRPPIPL